MKDLPYETVRHWIRIQKKERVPEAASPTVGSCATSAGVDIKSTWFHNQLENCQKTSNCKTAILIFRQLLFLLPSGLPFPFHLPLPVSCSMGISRWGWSGTQNMKKLEIARNQYGPIAI